VRRRCAALDDAASRCIDFAARLGGNVAAGAEPVFKSLQDKHEYALLSMFITQRAIPFIEFWANAIETVDDGTALAIEPGNIPPWVDE
jgi:hypothetical protein